MLYILVWNTITGEQNVSLELNKPSNLAEPSAGSCAKLRS